MFCGPFKERDIRLNLFVQSACLAKVYQDVCVNGDAYLAGNKTSRHESPLECGGRLILTFLCKDSLSEHIVNSNFTLTSNFSFFVGFVDIRGLPECLF